MKKLYTFATVIAVSLSVNAALPSAFKEKVRIPNPAKSIVTEKDKSDKQIKCLRAPMKASEAGKWLPTEYTSSFFEDEQWLEDIKVSAAYDKEGRLSVETLENLFEGGFEKAEYTYGDNGAVTVVGYEGETAEELVPMTKWIREYDPIIPSLTVKSERLLYNEFSGEWETLSVSYVREVTRNDQGAVTAVVYSTYYQGEYTPVQKVLIGYGEDGLASTITEYQLSYDENYQEYWQEGTSYYDCKWYETDGQIYDLDCVFEGGNKIKTYSQTSEGDYVGAMTVTYVGDSDDFTCEADYGGGVSSTQTWTNYPNNGYQSVVNFVITDGEDVFTQATVEGEEHDVLGNVTFSYAYEEFDGEIEVYDWQMGESELGENGMPTTYTLRMFMQSYDDEGWSDYYAPRTASRSGALELDPANPPVAGEWTDAVRIDYETYTFIQTTGVSDVEADSNVPAEYFNLQGMRVNNPANGLYIVRKGSTISKQIVK